MEHITQVNDGIDRFWKAMSDANGDAPDWLIDLLRRDRFVRRAFVAVAEFVVDTMVKVHEEGIIDES